MAGLNWLLVVLFVSGICGSAEARGRQPDSQDGFPDYNHLEYRKKQPDFVPDTTPPSPAQAPVSNPSVGVSTSVTSDFDSAPKPPPAAIPVPRDDSEPVLPDDMLKTLTPSATGQK